MPSQLLYLLLVLLLINPTMATLNKARNGVSVCVVGGGAAGYMSAIIAASTLKAKGIQGTVRVMELSKTPLQKGYPRGEKELLGPYSKAFGPKETYEWFSSRTPLKTEADGRVFPTSDKSASIIKCLEDAASDAGVLIELGTNVKSVEVVQSSTTSNSSNGGGSFKITYTQRGEERERGLRDECIVDRLIMATGSSRAGFDMMQQLGHAIIPPNPSLFSFKIKDPTLTALSGASVPNARVKLVIPKKFREDHKNLVKPNELNRYEQEGPLLVTHQGLSGPAVLRLSAFGANVLAQMNYEFECLVNWIPEIETKDVLSHFEYMKSKQPQKSVNKAFPRLTDLAMSEEEEWEQSEQDPALAAQRGTVPKRLWQLLLLRAGVDPATTPVWGELKNEVIAKLAREVCEGRFRVQGRGQYRDEFVTAGGVTKKEIDFSCMGSKLVPGLFLCGEVVDVDGVTGGYNFQSAWTTGYLAGQSAALSLDEEEGDEEKAI